MKKLLSFAFILISSTAICQSRSYQSSFFIDSVPKTEWRITLMIDFTDSTKQLKFEPKYLRIEGDTVKAILFILHELHKYQNSTWEAENVLRYLTTQGQVTNWKEFYRATDRYLKVRDYNAVMSKPIKIKSKTK